jgi:hypothetical protein
MASALDSLWWVIIGLDFPEGSQGSARWPIRSIIIILFSAAWCPFIWKYFHSFQTECPYLHTSLRAHLLCLSSALEPLHLPQDSVTSELLSAFLFVSPVSVWLSLTRSCHVQLHVSTFKPVWRNGSAIKIFFLNLEKHCPSTSWALSPLISISIHNPFSS